jgi:hypothetical protein
VYDCTRSGRWAVQPSARFPFACVVLRCEDQPVLHYNALVRRTNTIAHASRSSGLSRVIHSPRHVNRDLVALTPRGPHTHLCGFGA